MSSRKLRKIITFIFGVLLSSSVFAFNGDSCKNLFPNVGGDHPPYLGPIYITTMFPSSSSYFSSTGPCALYGILKRDVEKEVFIATNWEQIKFQMALGNGPHIKALGPLMGCPYSSMNDLTSLMKKKFSVLKNSGKDQPGQFLKAISHEISTHPKLRGECLLSS